MDYKIVIKESFTVVGVAAKGSHRNPRDKELIGSLWDTISKRYNELKQPIKPGVITGICIPPASPDYYYIAGVEVNEKTATPSNMVKQTFPELTYISYTHKGPVNKLFETYGRIWGEWFPASGYKMADGPEIEIVNTEECPDPFHEDYNITILIPIVTT